MPASARRQSFTRRWSAYFRTGSVLRKENVVRLTVMIPTFRRRKDLARCLDALKSQIRLADEIVITVRDIDDETRGFLAEYEPGILSIRMIDVFVGGVVAAMNEGLRFATGDVIAITDDDTAPYPDWLKRIEAYFLADPKLGGVGGRDFQPHHPGQEPQVGIVQWWGRVIGNHHLGIGPARDVDVLKGANCAYRTAVLKEVGFDRRLLGEGAQVNWELGLGLAIRRRGWRMVYDPVVALDHFPGIRHDDDQIHRGIFSAPSHCSAVHNGTLFLWEDFPLLRRIVFFIWFLLIGTRGEPGVLLYILALLNRDPNASSRFRATIDGRFKAIRTARQSRVRIASN